VRGCLFTLLLAAALIGLFLVVGLPALAEGILTAGVTAAGLQSDDTTVTVSSDPPTDLMGLHADHVQLTASDARFRSVRIGSLDISCVDMELGDRSCAAIDGRLHQVTATDAAGQPLLIDLIRLGGGGNHITATATIAGGEVEGLISDAISQALGGRPTSVALAAPDRVTVAFGPGSQVTGRFVISPGGDLAIQVTSGKLKGHQVTALAAAALPVRLTNVSVADSGDLVLGGELSIGLFG